MSTLYTIGHSNHTLDHFISLIEKHNVATVVDVRSSPYSKYTPQFSKAELQHGLETAGFEYVFLGRELGARRDEEACYVNGQARYDRIAHVPRFREGLKNVLDRAAHDRVALMCSEADPLVCHRTILVCRELLRLQPDLKIAHILPDGALEQHRDAEERLMKLHKLEPELFGDLNTTAGLIERAYDLQGEKIAYKRASAET